MYVLDSKISQLNKQRIGAVSSSYGRKKVKWILAKDISKEMNMEVAIDRGALSQYARLFISSTLPEELKRVLYLDCDTIINRSL